MIQNKNNFNHVGKLFKRSINETNNNFIFDNHYMIPGLTEITKLTGIYFFVD